MLEESINLSLSEDNISKNIVPLQRRNTLECLEQSSSTSVNAVEQFGHKTPLTLGDIFLDEDEDEDSISDGYKLNETFSVRVYGANYDPFADQRSLVAADILDRSKIRYKCNKTDQPLPTQDFQTCWDYMGSTSPPPTSMDFFDEKCNDELESQLGITETELIRICNEAETRISNSSQEHTNYESSTSYINTNIAQSIANPCNQRLEVHQTALCKEIPVSENPMQRAVQVTQYTSYADASNIVKIQRTQEKTTEIIGFNIAENMVAISKKTQEGTGQILEEVLDDTEIESELGISELELIRICVKAEASISITGQEHVNNSDSNMPNKEASINNSTVKSDNQLMEVFQKDSRKEIMTSEYAQQQSAQPVQNTSDFDEGSMNNSEPSVSNMAKIIRTPEEIPECIGFKTASCKTIAISKKAQKRAAQILEEVLKDKDTNTLQIKSLKAKKSYLAYKDNNEYTN